jgi:hypothetical protein
MGGALMGRGKARRSLELIDTCIEILREIQPATVRAVCYRLFTLGFIDSMAKNETNRVGRQLVDAREDGSIPWVWIVDETRGVEGAATWANPTEFADAVTRSYRRNKWSQQPVRLEVWSEKGTVRGTLALVLDRYEVPFRVMHGFASATALYTVAREYVEHAQQQPLEILYVGDWDPSGLHMSEEDLPTRLHNYCVQAWGEHGIPLEGEDEDVAIAPEIHRIALTETDVTDSALPWFEADTKHGDPRYRWFVDEYGEQCWELDALSPVILRERVEAAIVERLDRATWDRYVEAERVERESIVRTVSTWRELATEAAR